MPLSDQNRTDARAIFALTMLHFTADFYISFITPLYPVFIDKLSLSLAQIGFIAGTMRVMAFVVQPGVGYFADRYRSRVFIIGGPLLTIIFITLAGRAASFRELLFCVALGSIGSSLFHPSTAGMIASYAGRHFGFCISIFNMGGTLAFGLGPLFITRIVNSYGLDAMLWTALPGVVLMAILHTITPRPQGEGLRGQGFSAAIKAAFGREWKQVLLIWSVMALRTFVTQSFLTFAPIHFSQRGYSLVAIGMMISLFTAAGAASGLIAGHLSDRIGYKPIFYATFILATPALWLLLLLPGQWIYATSTAAGFLIFATLPLGLVMAQKLAPQGKSMVSSLMMGLAQGVGGMLTPVVGLASEAFTISTVLCAMATLPALSLLLVRLFPEERLRR